MKLSGIWKRGWNLENLQLPNPHILHFPASLDILVFSGNGLHLVWVISTSWNVASRRKKKTLHSVQESLKLFFISSVFYEKSSVIGQKIIKPIRLKIYPKLWPVEFRHFSKLDPRKKGWTSPVKSWLGSWKTGGWTDFLPAGKWRLGPDVPPRCCLISWPVAQA